MHIKRPRLSPVLPRRNDRARAPLREEFDQRVCIVSLVRHDGLCRNSLDQCLGLRDVVRLTGGQSPTGQLPQAFDQRVNLGGQPATRAAQRLFPVFLGAPAACWWAWTIVESKKISSKSASMTNAENTRCHTPLFDQRAKRMYTLFQTPNFSGRSRHGQPVRATHNTASTNCRSVLPGSLGLPGNICSMCYHWSSRNIFRTISPTFLSG